MDFESFEDLKTAVILHDEWLAILSPYKLRDAPFKEDLTSFYRNEVCNSVIGSCMNRNNLKKTFSIEILNNFTLELVLILETFKKNSLCPVPHRDSSNQARKRASRSNMEVTDFIFSEYVS